MCNLSRFFAVILLCSFTNVIQAQVHPLSSGWSLVGNDSGTNINPVTVFGNAITPIPISASVVTVWTWDNSLSRWNFFAPSMTPSSALTYAISKGYGTLSTIAKGEGFWVNATIAVSVNLAATTPPDGSSTVPPVTLGNVYIQDFPAGPFNLVNLSTGVLTPQTSVACGGISSASVGADGVAIGTRSDRSVVKVDPVSGVCSTIFTAPEWIDALAIAPDGTLVGQSQASLFGVKQIYRFSPTGGVLSTVSLTGAIKSFGGFSYAPDGRLYGGGGLGQRYELNAITGVTAQVSGESQMLSEVCIDSTGTAYAHSFGILYRYNAITGALLGTKTLQRDITGGSIICR